MENAFWVFLGSIVTIIATKLLEIYQTNKANKFTLQKIYFEKKISAAEEAISDLHEEITGIDKYVRVYEKIANSDLEKLPIVFKEIELLNKEAQSAVDATNRIANAMYLYFDFDDYIEKESSNLKSLLDITTEIRALDFDMEIKGKLLNEYSGNKQMQQIIYEEIKKITLFIFPN